jgi:hypothetical protein
MSQILHIPLGMTWFRQANKYLENLVQIHTSDYGTVTVQKEEEDKSFELEFDYIIKNLGL